MAAKKQTKSRGMEAPSSQNVTVSKSVEKIKNGYLITHTKSTPTSYKTEREFSKTKPKM